jgi:signal transduction histidine kinase/DNA-binding NarL/FixJ family response regulator
MDFFLTGPSSVLVVADSSAVRSDLTAAIDQREFSTPVKSAEVRNAGGTDAEPVTARGVSTAEAATDAVAADGQIGCVVTTASLPNADVAEFVADVAERRPNLPVVVYPEDGGEQLASAVTCAGADVYLPRADGTNRERVLDEIESALAECDRRHRNEAESDMFDYVLRNLDINVYVKDGRGRHLKTADQPNSPTPEEVIGLTDPEVYGDEDAAAEATSDDRRVLDGHPIVRKVERWNDDTGDRWYRTTKIPWRVGGDVVGLVGVTKDITDRKRKAVALEEFADYVSHDLRSPLNVASGFVDMARDTGDVTALDRAESALQRMDQMIDDLTTLVRSNADRSTEVASSPIAPLVRDVWDVVGTDEATLELDVPEGSAITAAESQIRPLFENLLKNAIDHGGGASTRKADAFTRGGADTGGRASGNSDTDNSVTVRVGLLNDGLYVEDDGPGIPEDRRDDVFSEGYTTAKGGSGIGLAIVSEIAESRQWDVQLTESSDGGARFEFRNCLLVRDPAIDADVGAPVDIETNADVGDPKIAGETTAVDAGRYTVEVGERTSGRTSTSSSSPTQRWTDRSGSRRKSTPSTDRTRTARPA